MSVSGGTDYTEFDKFGWIAVDATFVFLKEIVDRFALRYGAGLGLGIVRGEVRRTDALCTGTDIQNDCTLNPAAVTRAGSRRMM